MKMKIRKNTEKKNATDSDDAPMYGIMMQDEYDNLYPLGFYPSLDDAIVDINSFLKTYTDDGAVPLEKGDLIEYASTLGPCFDREVEWEHEDDCPGVVRIRGFVLSARSVMEKATDIIVAARKSRKRRG